MEAFSFYVAITVTLLTAGYAWIRGERISQVGIFLAYLLIAAGITVATTAVAVLANFSFLGDNRSESTGLLIGCILGFGSVGLIAGRLSERYPLPFVWLFVAITLATDLSLDNYLTISEFQPATVVLGSCVAGLLLAFILFFTSRKNLSNNQSLTVMVILLLSMFALLVSSSIFPAGKIVVLVLITLICLHCLDSGLADNREKRLLVTMVGVVVADLALSLLIYGIFNYDGLSVLIPRLVLFGFTAVWIRYQRDALPKSYYAASLFTLSAYIVAISFPSDWDRDIAYSAAGYGFLISALACGWYGIIKRLPKPWSIPKFLRWCTVSGAFAVIITVIGAGLNIPLVMLSINPGPTEQLAKLKGTAFWPGDWFFIRVAVADQYLWADEAKPFALFKEWLSAGDTLENVKAVRDRYSDIISKKEVDDKATGMTESAGFHYEIVDGMPVAYFVTKSSLAAQNGLKRGDALLAMNGRSAGEQNINSSWHKIVNSGKPFTITVRSADNNRCEVTAQKQRMAVDPPFARIFTAPSGRRIGYLFFNSFYEAEGEHLDVLFKYFKEAGIERLIVDLRYNSGGRGGVNLKLASLIVGAGHKDKLYIRRMYSERYQQLNNDSSIKQLPWSLDVKRLVVITTNKTASASEELIMGLKPYTRMVTVGEKTYGKPYAMRPMKFGDQQLFLVVERMYNANGISWQEDGIKADIPAHDDLSHNLGDPQENMLKAALQEIDRI